MKLRTNKVLKIFAILLFSLESLAPSVFFDSCGLDEFVRFPSIEKTHTFQKNLVLSLFTEACDTEERVEAGGKQIVLTANQLLEECALRFSARAYSCSFQHSRQERCAFTPPLFELHCTYLI